MKRYLITWEKDGLQMAAYSERCPEMFEIKYCKNCVVFDLLENKYRVNSIGWAIIDESIR